MKKCTKCKIDKPLEEFNREKRNRDGLMSWCRECWKEYKKQYNLDNKDKIKQYRLDNKDKISEQQKQYNLANRDKIAEQKKQYRLKNIDSYTEYNKQHYLSNKDKVLEQTKEYRLKNKDKIKQYRLNNRDKIKQYKLKLKIQVFTHYGLKCSCCGESGLEFLNIDHINNDGAQHRKEIGSGKHIYLWLIKNNFPSGFQTLCFNCNIGKYHNNGICPHQLKNNI